MLLGVANKFCFPFREELEVLVQRLVLRPFRLIAPLPGAELAGGAASPSLGVRRRDHKEALEELLDFLTADVEVLAKAFLLFDCQPYSENLVAALLRTLFEEFERCGDSGVGFGPRLLEAFSFLFSQLNLVCRKVRGEEGEKQ